MFYLFWRKKGNWGRKKREEGREKEEGAIVWGQWRSTDREMNLGGWGLVREAIDRAMMSIAADTELWDKPLDPKNYPPSHSGYPIEFLEPG
jgi:hypothetical protein